MLEDSFRWQQAARRYAELRDLTGGMTPQQRGQQFNDVIAELLNAFGIPAKSNQRSVGELALTFKYAAHRHVPEHRRPMH